MNAKVRLSPLDRWLTLWVAAAMAAGILAGLRFPALREAVGALAWPGSGINAPLSLFVALLITPMMMRLDFRRWKDAAARPAGYGVTLFVNWVVKPAGMALLAWFFLRVVFARWIPADLAGPYTAGLILLAAAPCTAMVFVWSQRVGGDPLHTLAQVVLNDLILVAVFLPLVGGLLGGLNGAALPWGTLVASLLLFVVVPLLLGAALRWIVVRRRGADWLEQVLLPSLAPVSLSFLLLTVAVIFLFQAGNLVRHPLHLALLAVPILFQVYGNTGLAFLLMRRFRVPFVCAAPGALIAGSNFFELAVATAVALYGPSSPAALATVVGVLIEVPVMLHLCRLLNGGRAPYEKSRMAGEAS